MTCALPEGDPIGTRVLIPARCDLRVDRARKFVNAELVIEEGAHLSFAKDAGLDLEHSSLRVLGTAQAKVIFAGETHARGHWRGVVLRVTRVFPSDAGRMDAVIEHASFEDAAKALEVESGASTLTLRSTSFRGNEIGYYAPGPATLHEIAQTTFKDNALDARIDIADFVRVDPASTFSSIVEVDGTLRDSATLRKGSYRSSHLGIEGVYKGKHPTFTIEEGAHIAFEKNSGLNVQNAALVAKKLELVPAKAGDRWGGILLYEAKGSVIEDARLSGADTGITALGDLAAVKIVRTRFDDMGKSAFESFDCKTLDDPSLGNVIVGTVTCVEPPRPALPPAKATILISPTGSSFTTPEPIEPTDMVPSKVSNGGAVAAPPPPKAEARP